jgi:glyoxylase-like metal-dependent hydrolase (beta-lactamase superfamily II)
MTRIADGVHRLGSELVNFYAVEEDGRFTLVDAGLPRFYDQVPQTVGELGRIEAIVLTHAHGDHVGCAERLRTEANVPVYVHTADEDLARTGKQPKRDGSVLPHLLKPDAYRILSHIIVNGGARFPKLGEVTTFTDGEVLDVPGRPQVIATPGHTDGHVALLFANQGALFVGDEIVTWNHLTGRRGPQIQPSAFNVSSDQALASLDRLESVDAQVLLSGHGEPWTGGARAAVEQARANGTS